MLKNHNNFHFTSIPDKANELIFLKSPKKPCFLTIFDTSFSKKILLSHVTEYGPLIPYQVLEKTNETILRKLTDRLESGWADARIDPLS